MSRRLHPRASCWTRVQCKAALSHCTMSQKTRCPVPFTAGLCRKCICESWKLRVCGFVYRMLSLQQTPIYTNNNFKKIYNFRTATRPLPSVGPWALMCPWQPFSNALASCCQFCTSIFFKKFSRISEISIGTMQTRILLTFKQNRTPKRSKNAGLLPGTFKHDSETHLKRQPALSMMMWKHIKAVPGKTIRQRKWV